MSTETPTSELEISPEIATGIITSAFSLWAETTSSIDGLTQINDKPNAAAHFEDVASTFMRQKLALEGKITKNSLRAMITPALFAGCGSTGFAAYNGIMRNVGLMPIFSDLDTIGQHNLPRQAYKKKILDETNQS